LLLFCAGPALDQKSNQIFEAYIASWPGENRAGSFSVNIWKLLFQRCPFAPKRADAPLHCNRLFLPLKNGNKKYI
jgi:hypothetical protein